MPPAHFRSVGRHRRPTTSRLPRLAATAAVSGALVLSAAPTANAHTTVRASADQRPTLRFDDSGAAVRVVQRRLGVPATGWYGPMTRAAVTGWQRRQGLPATGVVDGASWRALDGKARATDASAERVAAAPRQRPRASRDGDRSLPAAEILEAAARQRGKPYRYGATGPDAFDCSGFTGYVLRSVGIHLPRTSQDQRDALPRVAREDARPGDLLFSHDATGRVYHVAIYAGDGMIWDSSRPGETVAKRAIWTSRISFGRPD